MFMLLLSDLPIEGMQKRWQDVDRKVDGAGIWLRDNAVQWINNHWTWIHSKDTDGTKKMTIIRTNECSSLFDFFVRLF